MFDYTTAIAFGSLVIILGGAFIFYLGMLVCDRIEMEYGKAGYVKKYDKMRYYKRGVLFLEDCMTIFTIIVLALYFILICYISYLIKETPTVTFSMFITSPDNIGKFFFYIGAFDIILIIIQVITLLLLSKQVDIINNDSIKCSKEINNTYVFLSIVFSTLSIFVASIIISDFLFAGSNNSPIQTDYLFLVIIVIIIYIVIPIILAFLNLSNVAYLHGYSIAREELSELKQVMKFIVHFIDERTLEGQKLRYENGIYTLSNSNTSDNKELNYTISEDKVHHVERIYDN